ncbi:methyl-accepting chemotaxis protein [Salinispira pacifica]|uniref:Methyl-accepting chemotaxis protein n=1 Tax=Salinispira pacifica TaxID=1307761 RepID=V5WIA6_9SPIO|nr:methyl-accepting chemotaxis protein [Salinispira pacifica]AHC15365.1 Methyl-accepting chemotaxis protein [Salinispira pacifica]
MLIKSVSNKIEEIYSSQSLVMVYRAQSLFWIELFTGSLFVFGFVLNLVEGDLVPAFLELAFAVILFGGLPFLLKGKANQVADMIIYLAVVMGYAVGVLGIDPSIRAVNESLTYFLPTLAALALLSNSARQAAVISVTIIAGLLVSAFTKVIPYAQQNGIPSSDYSFIIIAPVILTVLALAFIVMVVYSSRKTLKRLMEVNSESENRFGLLANAVGSVKDGVNISEKLDQSAQSSLDSIRGINSEIISIQASISRLQEEIDQTGAAYANIQSAEKAVAGEMHTQSSAVEQTSSVIAEITASIKQLSHSANDKKTQLEELISSEKAMAARMGTTANAFQSSREASAQMLEVIHVIRDISERTNLLAMNASIEAAHAGDRGRGFAVVAHEIRKLSGEISDNLTQIQNRVTDNVAEVDQAVSAFGEMEGQFHKISSKIQDVHDSLGEMISGLRELAAGSDEIQNTTNNLAEVNNLVHESLTNVSSQISAGSKSVESISDSVRQISGSVNQIGDTAQSIEKESESIVQIGQENTRHIRVLEESLG